METRFSLGFSSGGRGEGKIIEEFFSLPLARALMRFSSQFRTRISLGFSPGGGGGIFWLFFLLYYPLTRTQMRCSSLFLPVLSIPAWSPPWDRRWLFVLNHPPIFLKTAICTGVLKLITRNPLALLEMSGRKRAIGLKLWTFPAGLVDLLDVILRAPVQMSCETLWGNTYWCTVLNCWSWYLMLSLIMKTNQP